MIFRDENEYLIHLLYCALHDTVPEDVPENISLEKVFAVCAIHEVANIAYISVKQLNNQVSDSLLAHWREFYYNAVKRDAAQRKARTEILNALHSAGIYTLEVQGTVVKQYYPQSYMRMMSDLDFIIPEDKLDDSERIIQGIGYETKNPNGIEIDAVKDNIFVELHTDFFDTKSVTKVALSKPYTYAVYGENFTATVSDTVFYLFHLLHTVKHCGQKGLGIRRIVDLYYLENALKDKVDYGYIDGILKKYGFYETKEQLLAVKDRWFNGIEEKTDISELEEYIFKSGNHGLTDNYYKNRFKRERDEGKHFVKLRYLLEFCFPEKSVVYRTYPFCEKHKLPVVLCWIYRGASVFNPEKRKSLKSALAKLKIKVK